MKIYYDIEQRSQQWLDIKQGKISASDIGDIVGTANARRKYINKKAFESFRKAPNEGEGFLSKDMQRGVELEPFAIMAIEERIGKPHKEIGFIEFSDCFGFSPDYVSEDLTIAAEIKCLQAGAMGETILEGVVDKKHLNQVLTYFMIPTIETVYYALYVPFDEMVNEEEFLYLIEYKREDCFQEIAMLKHAIVDATKEIREKRIVLSQIINKS